MPGGRMPNCPASASKGFSSTPVKTGQRQDFLTSGGLDDGVVSDDEGTFSLLSPIYHESFDSDDDDLEPSPAQHTSHLQNKSSRASVSPIRCELPRTPSEHSVNATVEPAGSPRLSAWELWLVNKAKEDRLKLEKKAEEEHILVERKEAQERVRMQKKIAMEEKIQEWLKMKREQEKQKKLVQQNEEEEEIQRQLEKKREIEEKAQQKYKNWLQKKKQEKLKVDQKEKEEAALKEEQERERRKRAEEKFNEWLEKNNEKSKASPKSPCSPTSPYNGSYPSPSFYNPIPWKPIHVPPPESSKNKSSSTKPERQQKCPQKTSTAYRLRPSASAGQLQHRR